MQPAPDRIYDAGCFRTHDDVLFNQHAQTVRIGTLDAADEAGNRKSRNEAASCASLLNTNNPDTWRATYGVIERGIVTCQRVWPTKRHKDVFPVWRNVQQVRRWIIAYRTHETELVHDRVVSRVHNRHVISEPFNHPQKTISAGRDRAV